MTGSLLAVATGLQQGSIVASKYRIDKVVGVGGIGIVVAAYHLQLAETVAIKFLRGEAADKPDAVARFIREARAAVRIRSEHVARIFDVGTLEIGPLDSGVPYIVMEYLEGEDLAAWVHERGAVPSEQAVDFLLQAAEGVAEAHGLGIVHRDLKPANLFCVRGSDGRPSIKVVDFGVSKVMGPDAPDSGLGTTRGAVVLGSPHYMSPEQMQAPSEVDVRTDIWALGIILYELLTGVVPFDGESLAEVCTKVISQAPVPLRTLRPDVPPGIEEVILKCLRKDRNQRYANVAEFARALAPFGPERARASVERISRVIHATIDPEAQVTSPSALALSGTVRPASTSAVWGSTVPEPRAKRLLLALAGAGLAGITTISLLCLSLRTSDPQSKRSASPELASSSGPLQALPIDSAQAAPPQASPQTTLSHVGLAHSSFAQAPPGGSAPIASSAGGLRPGTAQAGATERKQVPSQPSSVAGSQVRTTLKPKDKPPASRPGSAPAGTRSTLPHEDQWGGRL